MPGSNRRSSPTASPPAPEVRATLPPGVRVYAIGDIHGRLDLLEKLFTLIEADMRVSAPGATAPEGCFIVCLGDYVDRGQDSAGVLDRMRQNLAPAPVLPLRGNHEAMVLQVIDDPSLMEMWRQNGGLSTLHSFGVDVSEVMRGQGFEQAAEALAEALGAEGLDFLNALPTSYALGDYFFCHAGVRPGVPLAEQDDNDLLWIRHEFLMSDADFGRVVVHGHTPVAEPEMLANRINIDTGAYATGVLTALALEGTERRLLQTGGSF